MKKRLGSARDYDAQDFLQELEAFTSDLRELIESECPAFAPGVAAKQARISKALSDHDFFAETYFPHYITSERSEFHAYASERFKSVVGSTKGAREIMAAPRAEAKSTLITQIGTLWLIVRDAYLFGGKSPYKVIPIFMDTTEQAKTMMASIKAELEVNPRLRSDFTKVCGAGSVWNVNAMVTKNNVKVQAFGAGKAVRGLKHGPHRPKMVILDDIENDENVLNKEQRDKLYKWVTKAIRPLGPPDGSIQIFCINTILHYDSVANRLMNNPTWRSKRYSAILRWPDRMDVWDDWEHVYLSAGEDAADAFYHARKNDMDAGSEVCWPAQRPLLTCMKLRAEDHHAFDCEYQNDPSSSEDAPFKELHYWVQPSRDWMFFGAHDPSLGKHDKGRDPSASLVGAYDRVHGTLDVVEAKIARIVPDAQIQQIINLQREYNCMVWGIETVQFQAFFASELIKRSAALGVPIPVRAIQPSTDKGLRIMSLSPHTSNGLIRFNRNQRTLIEQLSHYPEANHDDGPDALHMLWALCVSFGQQMDGIRTGLLAVSSKYNYGH